MPPEIYVITGATGHVGMKLCEILLSQGKKVRAVARNMEKLKPLMSKRAEIFQGNMEDQGTMTRAFTGAKAVFTMIPPNFKVENFRMYQNRMSQVYRASVIGAGVRSIVNLSSLGANHAEGFGPINGLHDNEERLNQLDAVNVLHLRPTYFMENHLPAQEMARKMGFYGSAIREDVKISMIAAQDIAAVAASRLINMDFQGKSVVEIMGPKEYTMPEITQIIAPIVEKPDLKYVPFSYEDAEKGMIAAGISKDLAAQYIEMSKAFNENKVKPTQTGKNGHLVAGKTLFEDLAKELFHPVKVARGKAAKKK